MPLPIGAEPANDGIRFRVWAPERERVDVVLERDKAREKNGRDKNAIRLPLKREAGGGYFSATLSEARVGDTYRYALDGEGPFPDPASRFQPDGPHGPSQIVSAKSFSWTDATWRGSQLANQVVYEMHVGTFTREGTWRAAEQQLPELARAGITLIEMMPIADFPGRFGWGYDGVNLFAPSRLYGTPDDLRAFIDRAHSLGIGVILDVVYNHLGPDGNYLAQFSKDYFTNKYETDWGAAINFDGANAKAVRDYFVSNAGYWIEEFHFDGLRLDATQCIFDASEPHIVAAISSHARKVAGERAIVLIAENEPQLTKLVRPLDGGGYGLDALWNDDFHHTAAVALTAHREAYYTDYRGSPQEFISSAKYGYLYQGQRYAWQKQSRGTPTFDVAPSAFVTFLENHDQVANSIRGARMRQLAHPAKHRALMAWVLLGPGTPMLFQGEEFAASTPFLFFADHAPELAKLVRKGRAQFLRQFPSLSDDAAQAMLDDPSHAATFERCKLDFAERETNAAHYQFVRDLIQLRRTDRVIGGDARARLDGAVLATNAFVIRYFGHAGEGDRLIVVNLESDTTLDVVPEPLLAPVEGRAGWTLIFSTEHPSYGGLGVPQADANGTWRLFGTSTQVFSS